MKRPDTRIMIVGSTGFVGKRLTERLLEEGHSPVLVGKEEAFSGSGSGSYYQIDITQRGSVAKLNDCISDIDTVIYLAASLPYSTKIKDDLASAVKVNIDGANNFIELMEKAGPRVKKVCYASTADVYGQAERLPIEEKDAVSPVSNYAVTKRAGEILFSDYCSRHSLSLATLRFSQIYGPGDNSPKLIPSTIRTILKGKMPEIYGDGSDLRDMLFIDDAAAAVKHWLAGEKSGIYNVATGRSSSVLEIVQEILRQFNIKQPPALCPRRRKKADFVFNTDRLNKDFGFEASFNLERGLRKTIQWCQDNEKTFL